MQPALIGEIYLLNVPLIKSFWESETLFTKSGRRPQPMRNFRVTGKRTAHKKFLEVQKPFYKKVSGRRRQI